VAVAAQRAGLTCSRWKSGGSTFKRRIPDKLGQYSTGVDSRSAVQHPPCQPTSVGELTFWSALSIDPLNVALRLWTVSADFEAGERTLLRAATDRSGEGMM
jgi:hypothetical protein